MPVVLVMLVTAQVRAEPPTEETVEIQDPGATRKNVALGLAIGGAAFVAASVGVSVHTWNQYSRCAENGQITLDNGECPYDNVADATVFANRQQNIARWVGTSLFAVGMIALGTALYLRVTAPPTRRIVRVSITPQLSPSGGGLVLDGRF